MLYLFRLESEMKLRKCITTYLYLEIYGDKYNVKNN